MDINIETIKFKDALCEVFNASTLPIVNKKLVVDELARQVDILFKKALEEARKETTHE